MFQIVLRMITNLSWKCHENPFINVPVMLLTDICFVVGSNISWISFTKIRVTHICIGKRNIIGSDNGLSPGRRQTIIWTSAGILLIGPLDANCSEIWIGIQTFLFKKMYLKMSSAKCRQFCLGPMWLYSVLYTIRSNLPQPSDEHNNNNVLEIE